MLYYNGVQRKDRKRKWISEPGSELPLRGSLKSLWGWYFKPRIELKNVAILCYQKKFKK